MRRIVPLLCIGALAACGDASSESHRSASLAVEIDATHTPCCDEHRDWFLGQSARWRATHRLPMAAWRRDGGTGAEVVHRYDSPREFIVVLEASNPTGLVTRERTITVAGTRSSVDARGS
jgi:hypothetical protein